MGGTPSGTRTARTTGTIVKTYIGTAEASGTSPSLNFGDFNAATDGLMIVCYMGRHDNNITISSISIGGSNGTMVEPDNPGSAVQHYVWAYRQVSSGNNNVTVTGSGAMGANSAVCVHVWLLTGNTSDTPYWYTDCTNGTDPIAFTLEAAPRSVYFTGAFTNGTGDVTITSFGTATAEAADDEIGTSGRHRRVASYQNDTDVAVSISESIDFSAATGTRATAIGWI